MALDSFGYGGRDAGWSGRPGACLGWDWFSHLSADVGMSQFMRTANLTRTHALGPSPSERLRVGRVLGGARTQWLSLLLTRDIVIVIDPWADNGADAPVLIRALLE